MSNHYETLGIDKNATDEDIKKAYRQKAKVVHPDKGGNADDFRKVQEAFDVLSDPEKRRNYDQPRGNHGFNVNDFFKDFFYSPGGYTNGSNIKIKKGTDLRIKIKLTLDEIVNGITKKIKIKKKIECPDCSGCGGKNGNIETVSCHICKGVGKTFIEQRTNFGFFQTTTICNLCDGTGELIKEKCSTCNGYGVTDGEQLIEIPIQPGVVSGLEITLDGMGNAAGNNGVPGNLFVGIEEIPHEKLKRDGINLYYNAKVNIALLCLGGDVELPTINGGVKIMIPKGTQVGTQFKIKGLGVPNIHNPNQKGDQIITIDTYIPNELNKEEEKLLNKLIKEEHFSY